jgi:hypothetical protein
MLLRELKFIASAALATESDRGAIMGNLGKSTVLGVALGLSTQPCLAAAAASSSAPIASPVEFNLQTHAQAAAAQQPTALTAAVSASAAIAVQEAEQQQKRRGMSKGTKTVLLVGGVALVAVIGLAILAANSIPPSY